MLTPNLVKRIINETAGVFLIEEFRETSDSDALIGIIGTALDNQDFPIRWEVRIEASYPYRTRNQTSIHFFNKELIDYPHIMEKGSLCMQPAVYEKPEDQFALDLENLKIWVKTYYLEKKLDEHYEYLIKAINPINGVYYAYYFSDPEEDLEDEDFGTVLYAEIMSGKRGEICIENYIMQRLVSRKHTKKKEIRSVISSAYLGLKNRKGLYCLLKEAPSVHGKFLVSSFEELSRYFNQRQKNWIHEFIQENRGYLNSPFPLFSGYRTPDKKLHWEVILIFPEYLPIEVSRLKIDTTNIWNTEFKKGNIIWAETNNISYDHFFGRGALPQVITEKSILIMGIGAIGSVVAETLARCGAKKITLHDIDVKRPGNICRSTYQFITGFNFKTDELQLRLNSISPHIECHILDPVDIEGGIKKAASENDYRNFKTILDSYDIVFDCTTDNLLMHLIEKSNTSAFVINLSITNHAQDLICALSPNISETVRTIYKFLNRDSSSDLFNPTGCWNPTFKASYNDISTLTQYALKHIIKMLNNQTPKNSFYITEINEELSINRV